MNGDTSTQGRDGTVTVRGVVGVSGGMVTTCAVSGAAADITMVVTGTGFTEGSVITFNDLDEPTTFISDTEVSTGVKPSLFVVPAVCPVAVRDAGGTSNALDFTFTEAEAPVRRR